MDDQNQTQQPPTQPVGDQGGVAPGVQTPPSTQEPPVVPPAEAPVVPPTPEPTPMPEPQPTADQPQVETPNIIVPPAEAPASPDASQGGPTTPQPGTDQGNQGGGMV